MLSRVEYKAIGDRNLDFLDGKVDQDISVLRGVMIRARNILVMESESNNRLGFQAAQILLAPDLPEVWEREKQKIKAAVTYIDAVRNALELTTQQVQNFEKDLFRSSLSTSEKSKPQMRHSAELFEEEVQVEPLVDRRNPPRVASWVIKSVAQSTLEEGPVAKSKSTSRNEYKDIAGILSNYQRATAKIDDKNFHKKLTGLAFAESKQQAVDKLLGLIIQQLKDDREFLNRGGKDMVKGLLKIKDVEFKAEQASALNDVISECNYPKIMKAPLIKQIVAKSPELQEQRREAISPK